MKEEPENKDQLILNYLQGKASIGDAQALAEWVGLSGENKKYYQQMKNLWEITDPENKKVHISHEQAFEKILYKLDVPLPKKRILLTLQRIAAVLIIPLALACFFIGQNLNLSRDVEVAYNEVNVAYGTRSSLTLSDGSRVWLNSGSKLRYPDKFIGEKRLVYLTGEAFFEVHSDVKHPFIVKTPSLSVQATGTVFNVEALVSRPEIKVSLVSGKVTVFRHGGNKDEILCKLMPNQMFSLDTLNGKTDLVSGDIYKYYAWKDGRMVFRNEPLSEVIDKISQKYNVNIELKGKELQAYRYRATFEEETLTDILNLLKLSSPVRYQEVKRKMLPDGSFTKRNIIIYPKNGPN